MGNTKDKVYELDRLVYDVVGKRFEDHMAGIEAMARIILKAADLANYAMMIADAAHQAMDELAGVDQSSSAGSELASPTLRCAIPLGDMMDEYRFRSGEVVHKIFKYDLPVRHGESIVFECPTFILTDVAVMVSGLCPHIWINHCTNLQPIKVRITCVYTGMETTLSRYIGSCVLNDGALVCHYFMEVLNGY